MKKIAQNVAMYFSRIEKKFYNLGFRYSARNNSNFFQVFIEKDPNAANLVLSIGDSRGQSMASISSLIIRLVPQVMRS